MLAKENKKCVREIDTGIETMYKHIAIIMNFLFITSFLNVQKYNKNGNVMV